jgi:hypothetical protein
MGLHPDGSVGIAFEDGSVSAAMTAAITRLLAQAAA